MLRLWGMISKMHRRTARTGCWKAEMKYKRGAQTQEEIDFYLYLKISRQQHVSELTNQ